MDSLTEVAQILVNMSSPKRQAETKQQDAPEAKRVCVCTPPKVCKPPVKVIPDGAKTHKKNRSATTIIHYVDPQDPKHPKMVEMSKRFSEGNLIPVGFESRFYRHNLNWKFQVIDNPANPQACFVASTVYPNNPISSGHQTSAWKAYVTALEAYNKAYPEHNIGKLNPHYRASAEVGTGSDTTCKPKVDRYRYYFAYGVNARHFVGLYNPDVQQKIKDIIS